MTFLAILAVSLAGALLLAFAGFFLLFDPEGFIFVTVAMAVLAAAAWGLDYLS